MKNMKKTKKITKQLYSVILELNDQEYKAEGETLVEVHSIWYSSLPGTDEFVLQPASLSGMGINFFLDLFF